MEYAKDGVFNIRYNTELNRLEIRKKNRSIWEKIQKHNIISFTMFSCLNFFLIYNFMKVLQNI